MTDWLVSGEKKRVLTLGSLSLFAISSFFVWKLKYFFVYYCLVFLSQYSSRFRGHAKKEINLGAPHNPFKALWGLIYK